MGLFQGILAIAALAAASLANAAGTPPVEGGFRTVAPDQIVWQKVRGGLGVQAALIAGDPAKPGTYVIRVKFPPYVMDRPHFHSRDRHVTVLKGSWAVGTGKDFDPAKSRQLPAGSYMFHPANGVHWDGSNNAEEVIVQVIGNGPVESEDLDPEQPTWVKVGP